MSTQVVTARYRPLRVACLVTAGSVEQVVQAARLNSLVWGGVGNPIIPVTDDLARAERLVRRAKPDLLHLVDPDSADQQAVRDRLPFLRTPISFLTPPFDVGPDGDLGVLDCRRVALTISALAGSPGHQLPQFLQPRWDESNCLAALYEVTFGSYAADPTGRDLGSVVAGLLAGGTVDVTQIDHKLLAESYTPLSVSRYALAPRHARSRAVGLFCGDPSSAADLAAFWNLRAAGYRVAFLTENESAMHDLCREVATTPARRDGGGFTLWFREAPPTPPDWLVTIDRSVPILLAQAGDEAGAPWDYGMPFWSGAPQELMANIDGAGTTTRELTVALPPNPLPHRAAGFSWGPNCVVSLDMHGRGDQHGATFQVPSVPELNHWASSRLAVVTDVRVQDPGIGVLVDMDSATLSLSLVHNDEIAAELLSQVGLQSSIGPAGEAARRIIAQLGGLGGCRFFRLSGVRKLLIRPDKAHTMEELRHVVHDGGTLGKYQNIDGSAGPIQWLLEHGVLQVGATLTCPTCNSSSRYQPESIAAEMRCARCGAQMRLASIADNAKWTYQPSGFFASHNEHGAVPVLLAMLWLHERSGMGSEPALLVPSLNLRGPSGDLEIDFIAVYGSNDDRVAAVIGECKGGTAEIEAVDIDRLRHVSELVRSLGVECHCLFATTRQSLARDEVALIDDFEAELSRQPELESKIGAEPQRRPGTIVLTGQELQHHTMEQPEGARHWATREISIPAGLAQASRKARADGRPLEALPKYLVF